MLMGQRLTEAGERSGRIGPEPVLHRLRRDEAASLEAHLLRLREADRSMRFCGEIGDAAIHRHCAGLDWSRAIVLGASIGGTLRGAAEMLLVPGSGGRAAELALSVEAEFQGRGIGALLLRKALLLARNRCVTSVRMTCLVGNRRMQRVAARCGAMLALQEGEVEGQIRAFGPNWLSLVEEAAFESRATLRLAFGQRPAPGA